jgi:NAD-dependent SIR2 family protein deacetylase
MTDESDIVADLIEQAISRAADAIRAADALLITAGAGLGVDSGLPDFRGDAGFWHAYPPFAKLGLKFVDLANPVWFRRDPEQAWGFYGHRYHLYRNTTPHAGFDILRRWGETRPRGYFVCTSNVDGHFQRAGFDEHCLLECHGSINHLQCGGACLGQIWPAGSLALDVDQTTFRARPPLPQCPDCGGLARPNVLMFRDHGWVDERSEAQAVEYQRWCRERDPAGLVVVELGGGSAVPTVRNESERRAGQLIRINPREPEVPPGGISIPLGALAALERIDAQL